MRGPNISDKISPGGPIFSIFGGDQNFRDSPGCFCERKEADFTLL